MRKVKRPPHACPHCGVIFSERLSRQRKFCSRRCKENAYRTRPRNIPRPCVVCGHIFKPSRQHGDAKYCSKPCIWRATKGPEYNARISRATVVARANAQRGRGDGRSYRKFLGRHEHRIVAEQKLGRALRDGEVVHHIDGDIHNNEPDNLEVLSRLEHMRRHGLGIPGMTLWWKPWEKRS